MEKLKIGVLASGRGSNFEAVLNNIKAGKLNAEIKVVISNVSTAGALEIARVNGIEAVYLSKTNFGSQEQFDDELLKVLIDHEVNFVVLAGYLKMISAKVIRTFHNRMLNIHPALLPAFGGKGYYGKKVHEAVLNYGCKVSGVTVHLVNEEYDNGPPVLQRCVPVMENDTPESLAERVLKEEHKIFTDALILFAENKITIEGRKVKIKA